MALSPPELGGPSRSFQIRTAVRLAQGQLADVLRGLLGSGPSTALGRTQQLWGDDDRPWEGHGRNWHGLVGAAHHTLSGTGGSGDLGRARTAEPETPPSAAPGLGSEGA